MSARSENLNADRAISTGMVYAIRFFALVALVVSAYLAGTSLSGGGVIGCGPDSGCDKVLQSRWAYCFGVPVSLFALAVYSLMLVSSFRLSQGTPAVAQRKAWARLVLAALLAVGATVWFVGLQVFAVQAVCPYCMVTHGSGFVAALLVLINAPLRLPPEKPWQLGQQVFLPPRAFKRAVLITLGALAGLVIGQLIHQPKGYRVTSIPAATPVEKAMSSNAAAVSATPVLAAAQTSTNEAVTRAAQPSRPPDAPAPPARLLSIYDGRFQLNLGEAPFIGPSTNRFVVVSLFDYTCHHCRAMHGLLVEAQQKFSNLLAIVSLPMPLDPGCNHTVLRPHPMHTNACAYARLGLAVWRADRAKHHAFDEWLFIGDKPPPALAARQYAAQFVGTNRFEQAWQDPWVEQQLKLDVAIYEFAFRAGHGEMPQLIVGEEIVVGSYTREDLLKLLTNHFGLKTDSL